MVKTQPSAEFPRCFDTLDFDVDRALMGVKSFMRKTRASLIEHQRRIATINGTLDWY
jgi:hypothetical protein